MPNQNRFPTIKKGSTFNGRDVKFYNGTGASKTPMPLEGVTISMEFKEIGSSNVIFQFTTTDDSIATTGLGIARMMPRLMKYPKAIYITDLTLTFPNGSVKPWGQIHWEIN